MMLYDNPFSPFARKVRMVLDYKGIPFTSIDALALDRHGDLVSVNARAEVPVLVDGDLTVIDSADIVAYLEDKHPVPTVFPGPAVARARARYWQRVADKVLDAVIHDISLWMWPTHKRSDEPPARLLDCGRRDVLSVVGRLEEALAAGEYICGELSIADFAVFPHVSSLRTLGILPDEATHPRVNAWSRTMRREPVVRRDLDYVKRSAVEKFVAGPSPYESEKIVWRGDRIEWLFCNGFHDWWLAELAAGRAVVPSGV